ncbi:hypothetical protein A3E39_02560 [Candidatus Uhrbacteria bacterium RIFCSPHIGHO2_12_FULL_60_25]|uniref:Uncharacterized protein n=1 Tax=Candidatus Uhrbacteria bacterium RIFCSPHIGHO2_12_FULL_60_25 TaxID=1802399 RepID=A0A1F7ULE4_9BACT|nr:MAG: hypothetical protein A3E39_02560 [Candidatus Uhrbacteria bacterium RIFCSPHIGHO2_12_FULL_60_25]
MNRLAKTLFVFPWALAIAALAWLVVQRFPPSGTVVFDVPFDGTSAWIDPFLPAERTTRPGLQADEGWSGQRVVQDPVYTSARLPGVYDEVDLEIEFRPIRQPIIEIGLLRDPESLSFEFQPIWYAPLEREGWRGVGEGTRRGYVRSSAGASVLASSDYQKLAVWHASATSYVARDPSGPPSKVAVSLRGSHDFWAVPAGNDVSFTFEIQDVNRAKGPDTVVFRVYRGDEELTREAVGIGGSRDTAMGPVVTKNVTVTGAQPGAYRIQFSADDDVFIRSIETASQRWVVGPRLSFGDIVGFEPGIKPGVAWSDSRHLVAETFHREGLQRVTFGDAGVKVLRTHEAFTLDRTDGDVQPKRLDVPLGDMRVIGDGWFSFTPEAFFAPQPRRVTDFTDPDREGIDAILTPYIRPVAIGDDWYRATVRFAIDPTSDHLRLALSAPNVLTRAGAVDVRRFRLTYRRPPLTWSEWWRVLRQEAVNAWRRMM